MSVENPLHGWQERYPLPESLNDSEFRFWTLSLNGRWRIRFAEEVVKWYLNAGSPELLSDQVDTFLGGFVKATGTGQFNRGLSPKHHGFFVRLGIEEQFRRESLSDSESS